MGSTGKAGALTLKLWEGKTEQMTQTEATNHTKASPMEGTKVRNGRKLQNGNGAPWSDRWIKDETSFMAAQPPNHRLQFEKEAFRAVYNTNRDFHSQQNIVAEAGNRGHFTCEEDP